MASNQYKSWSGDARMWSQVREVQPVVCQGCNQPIDTRMELVVDGKCEGCIAWDALQAVPSYVERQAREFAEEKVSK